MVLCDPGMAGLSEAELEVDARTPVIIIYLTPVVSNPGVASNVT